MKLQELKGMLMKIENINIELPNGKLLDAHFHVSELTSISKKSIDCGGELHTEKNISLQIWIADDVEHRLSPDALLGIISTSEEKLALTNEEIQVEYQSETLGLYGVTFVGDRFVLTNTRATCKAMDSCTPITKKVKQSMKELSSAICTPGSDCC